MKYQFNVTFIPELFLQVNLKMNELHPEFDMIALHRTIVVSHTQPKSIAEIKQDIIAAFQGEKLKVIKIEGGMVE